MLSIQSRESQPLISDRRLSLSPSLRRHGCYQSQAEVGRWIYIFNKMNKRRKDFLI